MHNLVNDVSLYYYLYCSAPCSITHIDLNIYTKIILVFILFFICLTIHPELIDLTSSYQAILIEPTRVLIYVQILRRD